MSSAPPLSCVLISPDETVILASSNLAMACSSWWFLLILSLSKKTLQLQTYPSYELMSLALEGLQMSLGGKRSTPHTGVQVVHTPLAHVTKPIHTYKHNADTCTHTGVCKCMNILTMSHPGEILPTTPPLTAACAYCLLVCYCWVIDKTCAYETGFPSTTQDSLLSLDVM